MTVVLLVLVLIAGCTLVYRSQHVDLHENRQVTGNSNRVSDVNLFPARR